MGAVPGRHAQAVYRRAHRAHAAAQNRVPSMGQAASLWPFPACARRACFTLTCIHTRVAGLSGRARPAGKAYPLEEAAEAVKAATQDARGAKILLAG